jgi:hypothetical protein
LYFSFFIFVFFSFFVFLFFHFCIFYFSFFTFCIFIFVFFIFHFCIFHFSSFVFFTFSHLRDLLPFLPSPHTSSNLIPIGSRTMRRAKSSIDIQPSVEETVTWLHSLIARWQYERIDVHIDPNISTSPLRRRLQRQLSAKKVILVLRQRLPLVRTLEIQEHLVELAAIMKPQCSPTEYTDLDHIVFHEGFLVDRLARNIKNGMDETQLLNVPIHAWRTHHIDLLLTTSTHPRHISRVLIQRWTRFESPATPLREDGPLRWLLRWWVKIDGTTINNIDDALRCIVDLPQRVRSILRYQCRQLAELGINLSVDIVLNFVMFSCVLVDVVHRRELLNIYRQISNDDPRYQALIEVLN